MNISTPSPATPTQTKPKPHSPTDSQKLSEDVSGKAIDDAYRRYERLQMARVIVLANYAILRLVKLIHTRPIRGKSKGFHLGLRRDFVVRLET